MALIVETGAIVADADSYVSIADADTYHTARGNSAWDAASDAQKEVALRVAATYLDCAYTWKGTRVSDTQSLFWPRIGVVDCDGYAVSSIIVPYRVVNAQCELALRALSAPLLTDETPAQFVVSETVDVISVDYERSRPLQNRYAIVDNILRCYVTRSASRYGSIELVLS
jgi:hypothetical protein